MMTDQPSVRESQDNLLKQAAKILRTRYELGKGYADVSSAEAADLVVTLEATASATNRTDGVDREEAIALAHRLVDDDQPEISPMWPSASVERRPG
ncbi:hypothetical protein [Actinomycetospora chibensis]|uniref:Uncharacterized protein n=1 Tax=Actinomycetospora chibensis TaxID=663606 RepID=A0ABV9RMJ7_9PSEU|nr:hypothetical protein [Actinomycetospora chibensis]MDD7926525.1 hypothetical protein [Actinomycetospora chibensis]